MNSTRLSDSFCHYLEQTFIDSALAPLLNQVALPDQVQQKKILVALKAKLKKSHYVVMPRQTKENHSSVVTNNVMVTPLVGFGRRGNQLNRATRQLVQNAQQNIVLFTPYFNLPHSLARDVIKALKRGVKLTIVVGDKTANDFFINKEEDFSAIGIIPYVYEMLLNVLLSVIKILLTKVY